MKYVINECHNDFANLIAIIKNDSHNQFNLSDFFQFVVDISEAIMNNLKVDLRFTTDGTLDVHTGVIKNAYIEYTENNPNITKLSLDFENTKTCHLQNYSFNFNAENVSMNTLSRSGQHMKYYINNENGKVIIGIVFYYI